MVNPPAPPSMGIPFYSRFYAHLFALIWNIFITSNLFLPKTPHLKNIITIFRKKSFTFYVKTEKSLGIFVEKCMMGGLTRVFKWQI